MAEFIGVVTNIGSQKLAASIGGTPLNVTTIRVGDGNGAPIVPNAAMTDLVRRVGNAYPVTSSGRDPVNPQAWRITTVIPEAEGPFDIREIGAFDAAGDMIAIAKHIVVEKRTPAQGAAVALITDIIFPVSETAQVSVQVSAAVSVDIAQLLRPSFLVVESATVVSPPAGPALGRTHIVPAGATGAWAGFTGYLAQWNGTVWAMVNPPAGHLVVVADQTGDVPSRWQRRTIGGWVNATASETQHGLTTLATTAEHLAGLLDTEAAHPKGVKAMIDAAVTALVNGAPVTLDTLKEIADALGAIFASVPEHLAGLLDTKAAHPKGVKAMLAAASFANNQLLRAPFVVVESATVTAPPGVPTIGQTHIVPAGATGAWAGFTGYLAQWNGTAWTTVNPPVGHLAVVGDVATSSPARWQRRTAAGWANAAASETEVGLTALATVAEHLAGLLDTEAAHPKGVKAMIDAAITALVNGAPVTLDTLKEIADVLGALYATLPEHLAGVREDRATTPYGVARAVQRATWTYAAAGGTANALTAVLDPAPATYADLTSTSVRLLIAATNTGAVTLNVNGMGVKPVVYRDGRALFANELLAGETLSFQLKADQSAFILGSAPLQLGSTAIRDQRVVADIAYITPIYGVTEATGTVLGEAYFPAGYSIILAHADLSVSGGTGGPTNIRVALFGSTDNGATWSVYEFQDTYKGAGQITAINRVALRTINKALPFAVRAVLAKDGATGSTTPPSGNLQVLGIKL